VYESLLGSRSSQLLVSLAGLLPHLLLRLGSGAASPDVLEALSRCVGGQCGAGRQAAARRVALALAL
jgi:hypothetical protein